MKRTVISIAVIGAIAIGSRTWGQEVVAPPEPMAPAAASDGVQTKLPAPPDQWRYRWFEGRWWYWTPDHRWMRYNDNGQWVMYEPPPAPNLAYRPGYVYPGYYHPYRYRYHYYPGVYVGVWPYENVSVGVGRRIGVDVWGGRGWVRVGPIGVGW
jgi:hypothetical protein